ncbi:MAG: AMP-binding protein [Oscillospiraceae bacterium]|jgi:long-chain acyl-CoA synthetase|nr:AMP-binding protein [Oscillospiraceae bacterium]
MKNKQYPYYQVVQVNNLKEMVNYAAEKYSDNPAFSFKRNNKKIKISYRQFKSDVDALGTYFYNKGFSNTNFAVIGENSYEWILTYFSAVNSGNVIVPLDKELPVVDIRNLIEDSRAEVLVYSDNNSTVADFMKSSNTSIKYFINMNDIMDLLKLGYESIKNGEKSIVNYIVNDKSTAAIMYTSGTTGIAKGVVLSHIGIANGATACLMNAKIVGTNILVLPLHHVFGSIAVTCTMLHNGNEVFINSNLQNFLADLQEFKPHNLFLVPLFIETFYKKIWDGIDKKGKTTAVNKLIRVSNMLLKIGIDVRRVFFKSIHKAFGGNLRLILSGGAPIDKKYMQGFRDFGINVLNGYGLTECSGVVSVTRNYHYLDGSVGLVLPCCEVRIFEPNESGHGEIFVKGNNIMLGYHNSKEATEEVFDGEWFKTGDIGYLDKDNFLHLSGRKKNVIVLNNGKNVYPEEVEFALLKYIDYIKEVVIFADNNIIIAEVFLDIENYPDCVSLINNDVIKLNKNLPPYMNIGKIITRDTEFTKTTTKKIKRSYND